ncbi:MAG TPA: nucleoside triphosphate pyrophosphohydrolase [Geminicoccaceae bacterium]|nr:nucleoside triphosphate pyrophosphohydrolase [Geminicoccaceae bacterium]
MASGIEHLLWVMARLRDPDGGCPWDLEQDFSSIAPYTIEEAYEVADAIARQDFDDLEGELGDLLLQVVYHAQMAKEAGRFDFERIAARIAGKMIHRHPHVFGEAEVESAAAQSIAWEDAKAAERAHKEGGDPSILADLPLALPALMRAAKLQRRAARVGFDWPEVGPVLAKLEEEIAEVRAELAAGGSPARFADEVGDLLFAAVNLARHLGVDGECALRDANRKFERRFRAIERALRGAGRRPEDASLDEMEELWQAAKAAEEPKCRDPAAEQ